MDLNLIISFASIIAGLVSIFLGIWVAGRLMGKFKIAIMFLITAMIVFVIKESLTIYSCTQITGSFLGISCNLEFSRCVINLVIILSILIATFCIAKMISNIDKHHKKK